YSSKRHGRGDARQRRRARFSISGSICHRRLQRPMTVITTEHNRVLYVRSPEPVECRDLNQLGWELLDVCRSVNERDTPLVAVALVADSTGGAFFIRPPGSQQDCDAAI